MLPQLALLFFEPTTTFVSTAATLSLHLFVESNAQSVIIQNSYFSSRYRACFLDILLTVEVLGPKMKTEDCYA